MPEAFRSQLTPTGKVIMATARAFSLYMRVPVNSNLDPNTVRQVLDTEYLLAMEWEDMGHPLPKHVEKQVKKLARVLGSDCHSFRGKGIPGSRYTWVKMANPTLEGLRLALLDGNEISIRRSDDEGEFDPFGNPCTLSLALRSSLLDLWV